MSSCELPPKSSASDLVPSSVSKLYSFSTGTREVAPLLRELVVAPGDLLLLREQPVPFHLPLLLGSHCVLRHRPTSYLTGIHTLEIGCGPVTHRASEHPASAVIPDADRYSWRSAVFIVQA